MTDTPGSAGARGSCCARNFAVWSAHTSKIGLMNQWQLRRPGARYIGHMQDKSDVAAIFAQAPLAEIDALLADMLRSGDRDEANQADLFVQDGVMFGLSPAFAQYLPRSLSLRPLRENIRANDYVARHQCQHTLGRIGPRANAKYLADTFDWCLENDPRPARPPLPQQQRRRRRRRPRRRSRRSPSARALTSSPRIRW
jgi:hypothetical protein